jgi:hypothetical protein
MNSTVRLLAIVDLEGRVLAAQFVEQAADSQDQEIPSASLVPLKGQYAVSVDVPREVLELPGPDVHQFLSRLRISWPANVQVPEIEIIRKH